MSELSARALHPGAVTTARSALGRRCSCGPYASGELFGALALPLPW